MSRESYPRARADQPALNLTPSLAATTWYSQSDAETNDGKDTMSGASVYTYASADASQFRKEDDGRAAFNVLNEKYLMPTDDEENKQHVALVLGLGGLYPAQDIVHAVLAPQVGETKRILDVGCGSGVWAMAMAKEFPHAQIVGVDLAPTPVDMDMLPSNCTFEIDDINFGLDHYAGYFDVVHCRIIGAGLHDRREAKSHIQACLKPGGILIWMDVDYDLIAENMIDYAERASERREGGSWCARVLYEMSQAVLSIRGSNLQLMGDLLDEGFWGDPLMDPTTCRTGSLYIPVGPWVEDQNPEQAQRLRYMGALMRQDVSNGIWTFHPLIKKVGVPDETLREWSTKGDKEMAQLEPLTWARWMLAWGRRRLDVDSTAVSVKGYTEDPRQMAEYPYLVLCDTQEKALAALKARTKCRENIPLPSLPPL